jgi:hypothetical protein
VRRGDATKERQLEGRSVRCAKHAKVTKVVKVSHGVAYLGCGCFLVRESA